MAHHPDGQVGIARPDEYQDGSSAGSLTQASRCWRDLLGAGTTRLPHRFAFTFCCPTASMAHGLTAFLRHTNYAGYVRTAARDGGVPTDTWRVVGSTTVMTWTLPRLEHLFMRLRRAGTRYASTLVSLDDHAIRNGA